MAAARVSLARDLRLFLSVKDKRRLLNLCMEAKSIYQSIGKAIRYARNEVDPPISQTVLGQCVGKKVDTICNWEKATKRIPIDDLLKIALYLKKPLFYFLFFDESQMWDETQRYSPHFIDLVKQTVGMMSEEYNMQVEPVEDLNGNRSATYLYRLFPLLVSNAIDYPENIHFDRDKGGIETHEELVELLYEHIFNDKPK